MEVLTSFFTQITNLNRLQSRRIFNLAHGIVREGVSTHFQLLQRRAILHVEMTVWIVTNAILMLCETIHSDYHTLQLQSSQLYFTYASKAVVTNLNSF